MASVDIVGAFMAMGGGRPARGGGLPSSRPPEKEKEKKVETPTKEPKDSMLLGFLLGIVIGGAVLFIAFL